jgi:YHYH protein/Putative Ig domain
MAIPKWTFNSNTSLGTFQERQTLNIPVLVFDDQDRSTVETSQFENKVDSTLLPNYADEFFFWIKSNGLAQTPWGGNPPGYNKYTPVAKNFVVKLPRDGRNIRGEATERAMTNTEAFEYIGIAIDGVLFRSPNSGNVATIGGVGYTENAVIFPVQDFFNDGSGIINSDKTFYYHSDPKLLYNKVSGVHSPILGYAFDGNPIYGPYGYSNPTDPNSAITIIRSSYRIRDEQRVNETIPDGTFIEDFVYEEGLGDLDQYNGRFCITPDYPGGVYAYFVTIDPTDGETPRYPYIIGPRYHNEPLIPNTNFDFPGDIGLTVISGELPPGLRIEGLAIVGTPFEVASEKTFRFVLRATNVNGLSDRTYSITIQGADEPVWVTPEGDLEINSGERVEFYTKTLADTALAGDRVIYLTSVADLRVGSSVLYEVNARSVAPNTVITKIDVVNKSITLNYFILADIPANNNLKISYTFVQKQFYVLDNGLVDYQLSAIDNDLPTGQKLTYYIPPKGGSLPPGLTLSPEGRIYGFPEPVIAYDQGGDGNGNYDMNLYDKFAYDYGVRPYNGYDSFLFDGVTFDFSDTVKQPRKLNRYYQFIVRASDGISFVDRRFRIYVVGDDYLRADNTIQPVGTGIYTADATPIRKPIWLTGQYNQDTNSYYLGRRRANNYITTFLDVYDPATLQGTIGYKINPFNNDGTASQLPPGMDLDQLTGEIYGDVPYQSAVTRTYKFTIDAIRYNPQSTTFGVTKKCSLTTQYAVKVRSTRDLKVGALVSSPIGFNYVSVGTTVLAINELTNNVFLSKPLLTAFGNQNNLEFTFEDITVTKTATRTTAGSSDQFTLKVDSTTDIRVGEFVSSPTGIGYIAPGTYVSNVDVINKLITLSKPLALPIPNNEDLIFSFIVTSSRTFTMDIIGEVESTIRFLTPGDLGSIPANFISTIAVEAVTTVPNAVLNYTLIGGRLPPGLTLVNDGTIQGKVNQYPTADSPGLTTFDGNNTIFDNFTTSVDREYTFIVLAQDRFRFSAITKIFTISITTPNDLLYSNIYAKPFLKLEKRLELADFFSNTNIFERNLLYRPSDREFGVQNDLKMLIYAGIETKSAAQYVSALGRTSKKRFRFGAIKKAVAKTPGTNDILYEAIYIEILDNMENTKGSVPKTIGTEYLNRPITVNQGRRDSWDSDISDNNFNRSSEDVLPRIKTQDTVMRADYGGQLVSDFNKSNIFGNSVTNIRDNISEIGETERNFLPLWMRTPQTLSGIEQGFTKGVVICYCRPQNSSDTFNPADRILNNIKNLGIDFKNVNFTVDRIIIDSVEGESSDKYIKFAAREVING